MMFGIHIVKVVGADQFAAMQVVRASGGLMARRELRRWAANPSERPLD